MHGSYKAKTMKIKLIFSKRKFNFKYKLMKSYVKFMEIREKKSNFYKILQIRQILYLSFPENINDMSMN